MLLVIDNYDSFTFNLVQYLQALGTEVDVRRNDAASVADVRRLAPSHVVISPGPCTPDAAGVSLQLIRELGASLPILGVCLGHQAIGQAYGGKIIRAARVMHGKTSRIHHAGDALFAGIPNGFEATRYHSLVVDPATLPDSLQMTAWCDADAGQFECIMGLRHRQHPVWGVQFHPESILSEGGHQLLRNFLDSTSGAACVEQASSQRESKHHDPAEQPLV